MNTARAWLGKARGINREIEALMKSIQETREQLTKITQNYSSDGAQATKDPHKYDKLVVLEGTLTEKVNELLEAKKEIADRIEQLEDSRQRTVLFSYYVRGKTLEEIAVENHYSYRSTKRHMKSGTEAINKNLTVSESWPTLAP